MLNTLSRSASGSLRGYVAALLMVGASTALGLLIAPQWGNSAVDLLYLPAVLGAAVLAGLGAALVAAVASVLAYNFFFTEPVHTFRIHSGSDVVTVVVLFLVALVTSHLAASIRQQAQLAEADAERNATIAGLARKLLSCSSLQEIADVGVRDLAAIFDCNAVLLAGRPEPRIVASMPAAVSLSPGDIGAAASVFATAEPTGRGITRVTTVEWQLHPVNAEKSVSAVIGLARDNGSPPVQSEQLSLLQSLLDQIALAMERARLEGETRQFATLRERDAVRSSLLSSIGEDLKPPIATIGTVVAELRRTGSGERQLVSAIASEISRLQRYLSNLLDLGSDGEGEPVEIAGVKIDLFRRLVSRDGEDVHLTPKEYAVLAELAKYPGRVLSHAHLLKAVWGPAQERQTEYLRVAVRALRQKLERDPSNPRIIVNEPAVGYRLAG